MKLYEILALTTLTVALLAEGDKKEVHTGFVEINMFSYPESNLFDRLSHIFYDGAAARPSGSLFNWSNEARSTDRVALSLQDDKTTSSTIPILQDCHWMDEPNAVVYTDNVECLSEADKWGFEEIDTTQLAPCMQTILADLKELTLGVGQIIAIFEGNTPGYNWEIKDGRLSSIETALTSTMYDFQTGTVTTILNSRQWKQATELSWARTLLHEAIHAYLVVLDKNEPLALKTGTYPELMHDYFTGVDPDIAQHEEMARNFVKGIADALEEYGIKKGYKHPRQFYDDMSWAGLYNTRYFSNLPRKDRARILNVNLIELTGIDAQGDRKRQKGKNAGC